MKRTLLFILSAIMIITLASSCHKYVDTPGFPPLTGRWYLQNTARYDSYRWQNISTGYENGTFIFKANGDVTYTDDLGILRGSWNMYPVSDGYYDGFGHYREGYHTEFSLVLYEGNNNHPAASWSFDDCNYDGSNNFKAVYTQGSFTYEYSFVRE